MLRSSRQRSRRAEEKCACRACCAYSKRLSAKRLPFELSKTSPCQSPGCGSVSAEVKTIGAVGVPTASMRPRTCRPASPTPSPSRSTKAKRSVVPGASSSVTPAGISTNSAMRRVPCQVQIVPGVVAVARGDEAAAHPERIRTPRAHKRRLFARHDPKRAA